MPGGGSGKGMPLERFLLFIVQVKMRIGQYPDEPIVISCQVDGHITGEALFIERVMEEFFELIAVVAVQSIVGSYPQKTIFILERGVNHIVGEAVFNRETCKAVLLGYGSSPNKKACKKRALSLHA